MQPSHNAKKYAYQPNSAKFYDETEYKVKYTPNKIIVQDASPCRNQYHSNTAKFDGKSTYN